MAPGSGPTDLSPCLDAAYQFPAQRHQQPKRPALLDRLDNSPTVSVVAVSRSPWGARFRPVHAADALSPNGARRRAGSASAGSSGWVLNAGAHIVRARFPQPRLARARAYWLRNAIGKRALQAEQPRYPAPPHAVRPFIEYLALRHEPLIGTPVHPFRFVGEWIIQGFGATQAPPKPLRLRNGTCGVGLPGLAAYGLYVWYRRRRKRLGSSGQTVASRGSLLLP